VNAVHLHQHCQQRALTLHGARVSPQSRARTTCE
jgi:hypothetical protein